MEGENCKIPIFNGENLVLETSNSQMEILNEEQNLPWTLRIEEDASHVADKLRNLRKKNKSILIKRIANSRLKYLKCKDTLLKIWEALTETFE
ncbi:Hypothetical protein CINCED_3A025917 [Cinara cedri]|uniref:Uncharacterized protein n=1 Tax=Cinara cedri TaxID=506608 RepID=A0A5E4MPK9_9HEMI|nr:Hypothetical protein CINCED_3A025917 [Cinara cedri]